MDNLLPPSFDRLTTRLISYFYALRCSRRVNNTRAHLAVACLLFMARYTAGHTALLAAIFHNNLRFPSFRTLSRYFPSCFVATRSLRTTTLHAALICHSAGYLRSPRAYAATDAHTRGDASGVEQILALTSQLFQSPPLRACVHHRLRLPATLLPVAAILPFTTFSFGFCVAA